MKSVPDEPPMDPSFNGNRQLRIVAVVVVPYLRSYPFSILPSSCVLLRVSVYANEDRSYLRLLPIRWFPACLPAFVPSAVPYHATDPLFILFGEYLQRFVSALCAVTVIIGSVASLGLGSAGWIEGFCCIIEWLPGYCGDGSIGPRVYS